MNKRILIAGGTGFIGLQLVSYLSSLGYHLSVLTREKKYPNTPTVTYYKWDVIQEYIERGAFDGVDTIINLTGANIADKKWCRKRKKQLLHSRTKPLQLLYNYIQTNHISIKKIISSSAVGYYGAITSNSIFNESSPRGSDFLAKVCNKWERSAKLFNGVVNQVIILRKGVVIGEGGMVKKLSPLAKIGINTTLGSGKQYLPWIALKDLMNLYVYLIESDQVSGVYNVVADEHLQQRDFSKLLLKKYNKNSWLPGVPSWLIKIMYGEQSKMLLEGTRIDNNKLKQIGFNIQYPTFQLALSKVGS